MWIVFLDEICVTEFALQFDNAFQQRDGFLRALLPVHPSAQSSATAANMKITPRFERGAETTNAAKWAFALARAESGSVEYT